MPEHTDSLVADALTKALKIFEDRIAANGETHQRPHAGYGHGTDDCCLTGAIHFVLRGTTYDADLEVATEGKPDPVFAGCIARLHALIPDQGSTPRVSDLNADTVNEARELEWWFDCLPTETAVARTRDLFKTALTPHDDA